MEQLEIKTYSRQEIADALNVKLTNHFKRDVESKLQKWGYQYIYQSKKVEITKKPEAAEEKLREIMVRVYDLDIQIDVYGFACFIDYLLYCEDFQMMPWEERAKMLKQDFGVDVAAKTLERWANKLLNKEMFTKSLGTKTYWMTINTDGGKQRFMVDGNEDLEADMKKYMTRRKELVKQYIREYHAIGVEEDKNIISMAWSKTFKTLQEEFNAYYYCCNAILLTAIGEEAREICELVEEISAKK